MKIYLIQLNGLNHQKGGWGGVRGRGGSRFIGNSNNDHEDNGDSNGSDDQIPASDKPRPIYIPPEIDDNDFNHVEITKMDRPTSYNIITRTPDPIYKYSAVIFFSFNKIKQLSYFLLF